MKQTQLTEYFSRDYFEARDRFCCAAEAAGARLQRYPIRQDDNLTIDVATLDGSSKGNLIVLSSGIHGVEGSLGSAMQLATLERLRNRTLPQGVGLVLIHVINPFGYAHHRRWNEDNVDLNRNFIHAGHDYAGTPRGYVILDPLLNPKSPPSRWEPFRLKALWNIIRYGIRAMKEAVATGQHDYPQGLFFGGSHESDSARIVRESFSEWVGDAKHIIHLDLHTGLGRFADFRLLLEHVDDSPEVRWFEEHFGKRSVECAESNGTSYEARGTLGRWATGQMADRDYRFATLEFGTHNLIRVLRALRAENRAFHFARNAPRMEWVRSELRECFCPASANWRRLVVHKGLGVIEKCAAQLASNSHQAQCLAPDPEYTQQQDDQRAG